MRRLIFVVALATAVGACSAGERVIVGAGTTLVDSGFMSTLEAEFGDEISVVAGSTAEILELAYQGAISVAIVHDERQELEYVAAHPETSRSAVFASRFLIVGPPPNVAPLAGGPAAEILAFVASQGITFVSRSDGSGTHARELALWAAAGVAPGGDWYVETGQGMGLTLQVADQRQAFTLVEAGAFLAARDTIDLRPVELADPDQLTNPYHALVVNGAGNGFVQWLTSAAGRAAIERANESTFGTQVYVPSDDPGE